MSAAEQFMRAGIDRGDAPDVVPGAVTTTPEPRAPIDWDRVQAAIDAVGIRVLYLAGIVLAVLGLADSFGWGPGGVVLLVAAGVPGVLRHREAAQRRKAGERLDDAARFRGDDLRATPLDIPTRP